MNGTTAGSQTGEEIRHHQLHYHEEKNALSRAEKSAADERMNQHFRLRQIARGINYQTCHSYSNNVCPK